MTTDDDEREFQKYKAWYDIQNEKTGGLILQATAARLLNTPRQNINRMVKIGKLKTYQFNKNHEILIGINEIEQIIQKRLRRAKESNFLKHKGTIDTKSMVDVEDITDHSPSEWAEEWIITQPEIPFDEFINKKKKAWLKKNPKRQYQTKEEEPIERTFIVLLENSDGQFTYCYTHVCSDSNTQGRTPAPPVDDRA